MDETLLHFTGREKTDNDAFSDLTSICRSCELWLSYCPIFSKEKWEKRISMACFSDFSLSDSKKHSELFGKFAIGFNKAKLIDYGANPVFYTTPKHYNRIKSQLSLLERMEELEKDRGLRQEFEPYQFTEDETFSLLIVSGLLQEYAYKQDGNRLNYLQREWRISFNSLPFAGQGKVLLPGMSSFKIVAEKSVGFLKFDKDDIEFIVVSKAFEEKAKALSDEISKPYKCF